MATNDPKDIAAKQRIISHMNKDHQDSLVRYLEHHRDSSQFSARDAYLLDISFSDLTIRSSGRSHAIPLDPPLASWRDARERLVKLDQEAIVALGRDPVTIKTYTPPRGFHAFIFGLCAVVYILHSRRDNFVPGSILYGALGMRHVPRFAAFNYLVQPFIIALMLVIHTAEATVMATTRLKKHSVPTGSKLWFAWVLSCFVEGFDAFQRFDDLVKDKRAASAKQEH